MRGIIHSREEANSLYRQCLSHAEELALIKTISKLTDRGMPPTTQIVRNLASETRGDELYIDVILLA
jgi:hypothetical protein